MFTRNKRRIVVGCLVTACTAAAVALVEPVLTVRSLAQAPSSVSRKVVRRHATQFM